MAYINGKEILLLNTIYGNATPGGTDEPTEETYTLSGTWVFNENIDTYGYINNNIYIFCNFVCQDVRYNGILFHFSNGEFWGIGYREDSGASRGVWTPEDGWYRGSEYRVIVFDGEQTVSKESYDLFTANAVKIHNSPTPVL